MHKYKVGDAVEIVSYCSKASYVGKVATITKQTIKTGGSPGYKVDLDDDVIFGESALKKVITNFEAYKTEILDCLNKDKYFGLCNGKIMPCRELKCAECEFYNPNSACTKITLKWLFEYASSGNKIVLSDKERKLLEVLPTHFSYVARDKNEKIYAFEDKPLKRECCWSTCGTKRDLMDLSKFNLPFEFINWLDEEPYEINDLLALPKVK